MTVRRRAARRVTTRARTRRRRTTVRRSTVRRRPKTATTFGSVAALLLLAVFLRASPAWRIALVLVLVALVAGSFLWTRRRAIHEEMQAPAAGEEEPR